MSFDKAFSGEIYNTSVSQRNCPVRARCTNASMAHKNAARVLPEPVGAASKVCAPLRIAAHA